jgi:hypothetical protein
MVFKSTSHKAARSDAVKSFSRTPAIVSELHAEPARAALYAPFGRASRAVGYPGIKRSSHVVTRHPGDPEIFPPLAAFGPSPAKRANPA